MPKRGRGEFHFDSAMLHTVRTNKCVYNTMSRFSTLVRVKSLQPLLAAL